MKNTENNAFQMWNEISTVQKAWEYWSVPQCSIYRAILCIKPWPARSDLCAFIWFSFRALFDLIPQFMAMGYFMVRGVLSILLYWVCVCLSVFGCVCSSVCVCVCVCLCVSMYVCRCVCFCLCACVCMFVCECLYVCVRAFTRGHWQTVGNDLLLLLRPVRWSPS